MTPQNTAPSNTAVDTVNARRRSMRRALAGAVALRDKEKNANADTVAATGVTPTPWAARLSHLNADVESLQDAIALLETELRVALGADRLAVAKHEQRLIPLKRGLDVLYVEREKLFVGTLASAKERAPMPADTVGKIEAIEAQRADLVAQLAAIDAEIGEAKAPIHRHEHDEIADRQHAERSERNAA